jgi:hypothetical protein
MMDAIKNPRIQEKGIWQTGYIIWRQGGSFTMHSCSGFIPSITGLLILWYDGRDVIIMSRKNVVLSFLSVYH